MTIVEQLQRDVIEKAKERYSDRYVLDHAGRTDNGVCLTFWEIKDGLLTAESWFKKEFPLVEAVCFERKGDGLYINFI